MSLFTGVYQSWVNLWRNLSNKNRIRFHKQLGQHNTLFEFNNCNKNIYKYQKFMTEQYLDKIM